ncbi:MAG TPA: 5-formyltetrahydrofolate cyclo-ligase [Rhabdochlamydiaceae bacterium]|nr:5-formyltetrahydrofolate cyclo-ligase [Rhabdochlamydiaceae bacterium]
MKKDCLLLNNKAALRGRLIQRRRALSQERRAEAMQALIIHLTSFCRPFSHVLSFASLDEEINLWPFNEQLAREEKLLLPRVENVMLQIFQVSQLNHLVPSKLNIKEPQADSKPFKIEQIPCILVPGLGFDLECNRLGFGKGHYDRFLEKMPHALKVGIGFREQFVHSLPIEEHDKKLDHLLLF